MIARAFRLLGWAELAGSGLVKIRENLKNASLPEVIIDNNRAKHHYRMEFSILNGSQESSLNGSQKSSQKIIELIKNNPEITIEQIAQILKISDRAVKKHISNLKEKGIIRRIGADKGGHWEVVK